ncbi:MAG: RepB family DNA primase [Caldilinea sp.]|nr:RepB family DNA primase [Caldilinea sp.]
MAQPHHNTFSHNHRQLDDFHRHRRILHAAGGLTYYAGRGGNFTAQHVTNAAHDTDPDWLADVYVTVYPLAKLSGKRGRNADVAGAGGLFAEFDSKDFVTEEEGSPFYIEPEKDTPQAIAAAWANARAAALVTSAEFFATVLERVDAHIAGLPVPPSAIVNSGGGRHCYWYLDEPVTFSGENERHRFAAFLAAWVAVVQGDPGAKDLARMLRVPGTVNAKQKYIDLFGAPLPVTFVTFDPDLRYSINDLEALLPADWDAPAEQHKQRKHRSFTGGKATPKAAGDVPDSPDVRRFNAARRIEEELRRAGCTPVRDNRWIAPQSTSGQPSIVVNPATNLAYAFSAKNPVGRDGTLRPSDIALQIDHAGDIAAFLAALKDGDTLDYDRLYRVATFGDIEPLVRKRLAVIAEQAGKKAEAAEAVFAKTPNDQTEGAAIKLRKLADQATARVTAPAWPEPNLRRLMVALLDKFAAAEGDAVRCSTLELSAKANMSRHTVITMLDVLEEWFVQSEKGEKRAALFRLSPVICKVPVFAHDQTSHDRSCAKPGTLALHTHYDHDAMCASMTPRRRTGWQFMEVSATAHAIRHGLNVERRETDPDPIEPHDGRRELVRDASPEDERQRRRLAAAYVFTQQSRFAATLPSLGGRALLAITHLQAMGGTAALSDLADSMGIKANRLSELVKRLEGIGIVTKTDHYTVALVAEWAAVLDEQVREMPTFGSKAIRTADWLNAAIAYQEHRMEAAFVVANEQPEQVDAMARRINAIQETIERLERRRTELEAWAAENLPDHKRVRVLRRPAPPEERDRIEQRRRLLRASYLAAKDAAIEAAKQAASYQAQSLDDDQVRRALALDGFTPNAIAQGVPLAHRYADSPFDPLRATVWQNGSWQEVAA